jgi:hypothetical protein
MVSFTLVSTQFAFFCLLWNVESYFLHWILLFSPVIYIIHSLTPLFLRSILLLSFQLRISLLSSRMWKETVMVRFILLSQNLPKGTKANHENPQSGQSDFRPIRNGHLPNTSQKHCRLSQLAQLIFSTSYTA